MWFSRGGVNWVRCSGIVWVEGSDPKFRREEDNTNVAGPHPARFREWTLHYASCRISAIGGF